MAKKRVKQDRVYLPSGSSLLDLALTNKIGQAFPAGHVYSIVGDSTSGKTFLSNIILAEACYNPDFAEHRLIYDDVEHGNLFDKISLFGAQLEERIEGPGEDSEQSWSLEEFYYNVDDAITDGRPFIYILDSMDGLETLEEQKLFQESKEAFHKGKPAAQSYGMQRAKMNAQCVRRIQGAMQDTNSMVFIISQAKVKVNSGLYQQKTRSGGAALKFTSTVELWLTPGKSIQKTIEGKARTIGHMVTVKIGKNRNNGQVDPVSIPLHPEYGIDDLSSCIEYLLDEGVWEKKALTIHTTGLPDAVKGTMEKLISIIEEKQWEGYVRDLVQSTWDRIREKIRMDRKARYGGTNNE